jgi:DNA helicase-2/ATP-dependent DNA helicase PcrA
MDLLDDLNPAQREAVTHPGGPLLVLAGAGSGKTRVLIRRVARLLEEGVPPHRVLAFTFTNRAAREMRERLEQRVGAEPARALWVGTFHATAVRLLRREAAAAGLPRAFTIYDREDQEGVLREVMQRLELPEASYRPSQVLARISDAKNALVTPAECERVAVSPWEKQVARAYARYDAILRANGALDFDDLIARSVVLLRDDPEAGARWAARFQHVLVDEYQDTNHAQFRFVERLARGAGNLFVVGDDDQSIYGWRGADLANVLEFEQAFPGAHVVRLEQNYRSTGNILAAANAVIAHNRSRKGKTLWCDREAGPPLRFTLGADDAEEARIVRRRLESRVRAGGRLADCAVLYRTHAQSRALELALAEARIAYEMVGGVSFYQRREVKDLLAYLRLAIQPHDHVSFWRAWNTPRRGLGPAVRAQVEARLAAGAPDAPAALRALVEAGTLPRPALSGARDLLGLLDALAHETGAADGALRLVLERTRYLESLDGDDDAEERRANVEELVAAAVSHAASGAAGLEDFLADSALATDADRVTEGADRVLLLTAHNAKGLEFPVVIVAGLEEGLFPHANSLDDPERLEEERRLFYVALTRAREEVLLTAAAFRRRYDGSGGARVSRFVSEIPATLLERDELAVATAGARVAYGRGPGRALDRAVDVAATWKAPPAATRHRAVGREVWHDQFGRGVVMAAEGEGGEARFTVRFGVGVKKVLGRFLDGGDGDPA